MIPIIEEMKEEFAYALYYLHWDGETRCESPAFYLFDNWSPMSTNGKWVLQIADLKTWEFDDKILAEMALEDFFRKAKENKGGYLYKKTKFGKLKVFARKEAKEHQEVTFVDGLINEWGERVSHE